MHGPWNSPTFNSSFHLFDTIFTTEIKIWTLAQSQNVSLAWKLYVQAYEALILIYPQALYPNPTECLVRLVPRHHPSQLSGGLSNVQAALTIQIQR